jgi:hypothetical protein
VLNTQKKPLQQKLKGLSDPDWIQTNDLLLRRQLLYSTELPDRQFGANLHFFKLRDKPIAWRQIFCLGRISLPFQQRWTW